MDTQCLLSKSSAPAAYTHPLVEHAYVSGDLFLGNANHFSG